MWYWVLVRFGGCLYCFLQHQNPNRTSNNLCRKSSVEVEVTQNSLVYDFFRFHHNCFRDTISWECIVEDACVRSCLIELQSFPLSKLYIDPVHRILVYFPLFLVRCKTWFGQIKLYWILVMLKNTVCLSLLEFCPPRINPEFVMGCKLAAHPI